LIDERLIRSLHVQTLRRKDLHAETDAHALFQVSTIGALLDGAYDGDVSFAELAGQGDLGLGTLNALDGEMIALGGRFFRADSGGRVEEIDPEAKTPFAVVVPFEPNVELEIEGPLDHREMLEGLDRAAPAGGGPCAVRIDGSFELVRARSVPRQRRPYRPLTEVVADQRVFELRDVTGTMVGFRFPDYVDGLEVSGYHLHFIDEGRLRGGHVLDSRTIAARASLDRSADLRVELPPGVDLGEPHLDRVAAEGLHRAETEG
jgi:acetolactate decarboxylase